MFVITPEQATAIATAIGAGVTFELSKGWVYLSWDYGFGAQRRRWDAKGDSHFPSWSTPWGGTRSYVFDTLVRAMRGKPVHPSGTWDWLVCGPCKLGGVSRAAAILEAVRATNWPKEVPCVLCGKLIRSVGDWWTIGEKKNRTSGPGCSMRDCREVPA